MPEPNVYSLLLQAFHADKSAARLLHALEELAGRLEPAEASIDAGLRLQDSSRTCHDLSNLQLPDPAQGPLPLPPSACEHAAMQAAAEDSSKTLNTTAEKRAWRSWVMSPQHMAHVVEAAWLLVALVFKREDACAAAVQAHVCQQIQRHHVSTVLAGQEPIQDCSNLWTQTLADAACRLLRSAFPAALELHDKQLQMVLQRQLRLYTTGLLPSDAAAPALRSAQHKAVSTVAASTGDDASAAADDACSPTAYQRASCCTGAGEEASRHGSAQPRKHTAQFISVKPGPAVSAFMAQQGLQPAPGLLQAHAGELTRITLPAHLIQQQDQAQQQADGSPTGLTVAQHKLYSFSLGAQASMQPDLSGCAGGGAGSRAASGSLARGGSKAKAAACMAAASDAVEAYEKRKAAAAASVKAGNLAAQVAVQALAKQKARAVALGPSKAKEASNRVSGYLSEAGAATTCVAVTTPAASDSKAILKAISSPNAAASTASPNSKAGPAATVSSSKATKGSKSSSSNASGSGGSAQPLPTDSQCKAQRQVLEHQLRAGDWRMAHAFNSALHDKCTNMAAAVATLPPAPITPLPPSAAVALEGQDWGALVSSSVARHHVVGGASGAGMRSSSGSNVKVMKAARAIVEDVQKAFAASGSPPLGKGNH